MIYKFKEENLIKSDKHSTITILISFIFENDKLKSIGLDENNAYFAIQILADTLTKVSDKYKTEKEMIKEKYRLYNAEVSFITDDYYKNSCLHLMIETINPKYVEDKNLLSNVFSLAKEKLYHPLLNDTKDGFDKKQIEIKKERLINDRKSIITNKSRFAKLRLLEEMKKEDEDILTLGLSTKEIEEISEYDIYKLYLHILNNSKILVNAYGNIEYNEINKEIDSLNLYSNDDVNISSFEVKDYEIKDTKEVVEVQDISQAKLLLGYRTTISFGAKYFPALILFSMMFGGITSSILFTNIREKKSLVYSIYSSLMSSRKIFIVSSANDSSKSKFIVEEVKKELNRCASGKSANSELLEMAKEEIINGEYSTYDSPISILNEQVSTYMTGFYKSSEFIEIIKQVTLEDVIYASKTLTLDTIYILRGKEDAK